MSYDLAALARQNGRRRRPRIIRMRRIDPPRSSEADYRRALTGYLREVRRYVEEETLPAVRAIRAEITIDAPADDWREADARLRAFMERMRGPLDDMLGRIFRAQADRHTDRFAASVRQAIGIDMRALLSASPGLEQRIGLAIERNVELVTKFTEEAHGRLAELLSRNLQQGGTVEQLREDLSRAFDIEANRAQLIARNEVANYNSALNEFRQEEAGIDEYIWRTSQDERVREEHAALEGQIFRWSDPGPDEGQHAGYPINCRCTAEPVLRLDDEQN